MYLLKIKRLQVVIQIIFKIKYIFLFVNTNLAQYQNDKKESENEAAPIIQPFKVSLYQRIGAKTENFLTYLFEKYYYNMLFYNLIIYFIINFID